jgi:hypothetical protein
MGFTAITLSNRIRGEARDIGVEFSKLAAKILSSDDGKKDDITESLKILNVDSSQLDQMKKV